MRKRARTALKKAGYGWGFNSAESGVRPASAYSRRKHGANRHRSPGNGTPKEAFKIYDREKLFLLVNPSGSKLWRWRYRFDGKEKLMFIGEYHLRIHHQSPPHLRSKPSCMSWPSPSSTTAFFSRSPSDPTIKASRSSAGARHFALRYSPRSFRIVEIDFAQPLEWQLVENSQRVDVYPHEEAQGFQRLPDMPGRDVAALDEKSGKSASHIYARLSLLQLVPTIARHSPPSASPPATQTCSPDSRRTHRPQPTSNAGARTGKTKNRTCYPPST